MSLNQYLFWRMVVTGQTVPPDILYLEDHSGDYPVDDDDFSSGSGSGFSESDDEDMLTSHIGSTEHPLQTSSATLETPSLQEAETVLETILERELETEVPDYQTEEPQVSVLAISTSSFPGLAKETDKQPKVHTENLFQRKEVLAEVQNIDVP
ncbi:hypothetical protein P4O66_010321 [Electrophorus voltai]|uniref:Uncharacterized protein n=1 Tax=Electrophorus voltai TaxID=2609070 RepID=A0AAD8Z9V3_9TELE|nr:hypothetical protein P4O66_010321 [Electrophorus voltai]